MNLKNNKILIFLSAFLFGFIIGLIVALVQPSYYNLWYLWLIMPSALGLVFLLLFSSFFYLYKTRNRKK